MKIKTFIKLQFNLLKQNINVIPVLIARYLTARYLSLALRSLDPHFELPTVFIFKYFINPFMEYLISIWWPSVSKIVQKHGTGFSQCSCHCKTVSNFVCLSEGATVTKGGLTDRLIVSIYPPPQKKVRIESLFQAIRRKKVRIESLFQAILRKKVRIAKCKVAITFICIFLFSSRNGRPQ